MAAPKYTDRLRAQSLRTASLDIMIQAIKGEGEFGEDFEFRKQLLLRLASNVLPRLNEHTGEDGNAILIQIAKEVSDKQELYETDPNTSSGSQGLA
jgi:hypothetical protein